MFAKLMLSLLLLSAAAVPAADTKPKPGGWGFNWLDPDSPCKQITAKDLAPVKQCEASANAFGIELKSQQCKVSDEVEWVIYDTKAHCQQASETMRANGD